MFVFKLIFLLLTTVFSLIGSLLMKVLKLVVGIFSLGSKNLKGFVEDSEAYTNQLKDKAEKEYEAMKAKVNQSK